MKITPVKTPRISPVSTDIIKLLDDSIKSLNEKSIVAITSKIISLCEGRALPIGSVDKENLLRAEADYYIPAASSKYGFTFTITKNTLIPNSGIDESNGDGHLIL